MTMRSGSRGEATANPSRLARQVAEVYLAGELPKGPAKEEDTGEAPAGNAEVPGSAAERPSYGPEELRAFTSRRDALLELVGTDGEQRQVASGDPGHRR